jgi:hypothetical protein
MKESKKIQQKMKSRASAPSDDDDEDMNVNVSVKRMDTRELLHQPDPDYDTFSDEEVVVSKQKERLEQKERRKAISKICRIEVFPNCVCFF